MMAKLRAKHTSGQELRLAAAEYFVRTVPGASWEHLANALYYREEEEAVQAVRKYYHAPRGVVNYMYFTLLHKIGTYLRQCVIYLSLPW